MSEWQAPLLGVGLSLFIEISKTPVPRVPTLKRQKSAPAPTPLEPKVSAALRSLKRGARESTILHFNHVHLDKAATIYIASRVSHFPALFTSNFYSDL